MKAGTCNKYVPDITHSATRGTLYRGGVFCYVEEGDQSLSSKLRVLKSQLQGRGIVI